MSTSLLRGFKRKPSNWLLCHILGLKSVLSGVEGHRMWGAARCLEDRIVSANCSVQAVSNRAPPEDGPDCLRPPRPARAYKIWIDSIFAAHSHKTAWNLGCLSKEVRKIKFFELIRCHQNRFLLGSQEDYRRTLRNVAAIM